MNHRRTRLNHGTQTNRVDILPEIRIANTRHNSGEEVGVAATRRGDWDAEQKKARFKNMQADGPHERGGIKVHWVWISFGYWFSYFMRNWVAW
jgi:hypothetical protein